MSGKTNFDPDEKKQKLLAEIEKAVTSPVHVMAVCSGYKVTIRKHHLFRQLPEQIHIHYGPGCPACLSSPVFIDKLVEYSKRGNVIIATYGDLLGIPGSSSTLEKARMDGAGIRVIHSIMDALTLAKKNRRKRIIFPAVGFESAASSTAAGILQAKVAGIFNFHVLCDHKRMLSGMEAVLQRDDVPVDGVISSGRVAASMGANYFRKVTEKYHKPQVISGYESKDVLEAILHLVKQINNKTAVPENLFPAVVTAEGNPKSQQLLEEVFEVSDAEWTGFGKIKSSGFKIKKTYRMHNAEEVFFDVETPEPVSPEGCLCDEIMRGIKVPADCRYFTKTCNPIHAIGACMYSEEGPCRVDFLFGR
ncbi:MAG: hydrogenase formation protein HypD [bacterium]|nr:MAG: hydrogenase formation protein HypD [bacterium]